MKKFSPGKGLVKTRLRFTRCLYAMLSKQDFRPDTRTGWNFPPPSSPEFKAHSLGSKLVCVEKIVSLPYSCIMARGLKLARAR